MNLCQNVLAIAVVNEVNTNISLANMKLTSLTTAIGNILVQIQRIR
jgi:hypothetical protein